MGKDTYKYTPLASYTTLKSAENKINNARTLDDLRAAMLSDGAKIGYKAFCYIFMGKMTPEAMKPDEAAIEAMRLENKGDIEDAQDIYRAVVAAVPDHPLALPKVQTSIEVVKRDSEDELIDLLEELEILGSKSSRLKRNGESG